MGILLKIHIDLLKKINRQVKFQKIETDSDRK